jgi:hypothetical protein
MRGVCGFTNFTGRTKFRNGPFISVTSFKDADGNVLVVDDNYKIVGDEIRSPQVADLVVEYLLWTYFNLKHI